MKIPIDSIRLDGDTQSRDGVKQDIVNEYADDMREGAIFPPVVIYDDEADKWLSEGFHRLYAARQAGAQEIEAEVRQGTKRDAQLNSMRSNATHGARRTNADKRRAVEMAFRWLIEEGRSLKSITSVEIADMARVSKSSVEKNRDEIVSRFATNAENTQVTEVTKSEAKELTVTQRLKEKVDSLEWKLRDAERQKEALEKREKEIAELKEKHRKESEAASKFEGEKIKLENEMKYLQERIKEIEGKTVEHITPPEVEDELQSLRLENSRIAAALEEAKRVQAPVALPEVVEKIVEKEVTPPEVEAKLREQENLIYELQRREAGNPRLEEKRNALLKEIERLRGECSKTRVEASFDGVISLIMNQKALARNLVELSRNGDLTIEQMDEAQNLMNNVICAANDVLNELREIRGDFKKGGGLRAL